MAHKLSSVVFLKLTALGKFFTSIHWSLLLKDSLVWKSKTYVIQKINQWRWGRRKGILFNEYSNKKIENMDEAI